MVFLVAEEAWWKRCKGGLGYGEEKRLVGAWQKEWFSKWRHG